MDRHRETAARNAEPWLLRVLRGEEPSIPGRAARAALSTLSPAYAAAVAARNAAFDLGLRRSHTLPRPVISVGNLSAGGTGKTPCVAEVLRTLLQLGRRPAVLMRGYRAPAHGVVGGDEAALYAQAFGDAVPVGANPDRLAAALDLLRRRPEVDAFVLDDGYQHRRVRRDLDLLLIDGESWGRDRLLPAGLLREPRAAIRRADLVIVTHADRGRDTLEALRACCAQPVLAAQHLWVGLVGGDGQTLPLDTVAGRRVLAVCGIGKPAGFAHALHRLAAPTSRLIEAITAVRASTVVRTPAAWTLADAAGAPSPCPGSSA